MLVDATEALISVARNKAATDEDLRLAAQSFFNAAGNAPPDDVDAALQSLSQHFDINDDSRAGFLALTCATMIERGWDPHVIAEPLVDRVSTLLKSAAELATACADSIVETDDDHGGSVEVFEKARKALAPEMEQQAAAWNALSHFWLPAIAVFSASAETRSSARHLRSDAAKISPYHEVGHWLQTILGVLDNEPIVAIEPQGKIGILGRISGIANNFQLNVLLMDSIPSRRFFARRRVPKKVVDVALGVGPQRSGGTVVGCWNLYAWKAIRSDGTLPAANDYGSKNSWIWNEGSPADIPVLDGRRAILLGPPSYRRTWQSQRLFSSLPARLAVDKVLSKDEADDWLRKMAAKSTPD